MKFFAYEGSVKAKSGQEEALVGCLLRAAEAMRAVEGCLLYIVGRSAVDPGTVRVFEVWKSKEAHDNSLSLPGVRALIAEALPLIDGRPSGGDTWDVAGGKGLA